MNSEPRINPIQKLFDLPFIGVFIGLSVGIFVPMIANYLLLNLLLGEAWGDNDLLVFCLAIIPLLIWNLLLRFHFKLTPRIMYIPLWCLVAIAAFISLINLVFSDRNDYPGKTEFITSNRLIDLNEDGKFIFGNTEQARRIAANVSTQLKQAHPKDSSHGVKSFLFTKDEYVTFCQLNEDSAALLVHVPYFDKFTKQQEVSLISLSKKVFKTALENESLPTNFVVGLRTQYKYKQINLSSPVTKTDLKGEKILYTFFPEIDGSLQAEKPRQ